MRLIGIIILLIDICLCDTLQEPQIIELLDGDRIHLSFDYCPFTLYLNSTTKDVLLLNYTAHCHCLYNPAYSKSFNCSIPGPTFIFYPGTTVHMTWYNRLQGTNSDNTLINQYRDLSVLNVHTHGFHISSIQDNIQIIIEPQTSYTYTYTIPQDHYPGMLHALYFIIRTFL